MSDLRQADALANRTSTPRLLRDNPLQPCTRRAVAGFKMRALMRRYPATVVLLRAAKFLRRGNR